MAAPLGFDNAIAWAQFQLKGGLRNILSTTGVYALCVIVGLFGWMRLMPDDSTAVMTGATMFLLFGQLIVLVFLGSNALTAAVRNDVATRMIDSHRLMPLAPAWAVVGYMLGATAQALSLAAVNFVIGTSTAVGAGMPFARWLVPHVILAFFVYFAWSVVVLAGFFAKSGFGWIVLVGIFSSMGNGMLVVVLPGLLLLLSPLIGNTLFSMRTSQSEVTWQYAMAFAAQAFVGTLFLVGATRKYKRAENRAMGVVPATVLLAGWVVMSLLGIRYWDDLRPQFAPFQIGFWVQFIGSLQSCMLLALLPIANSVQLRLDWDRHRRLDDPALGRRPLPPLAVALIASAIVLSLCLVVPREGNVARPMALTAVVVVAFLVSMRYLLDLVYRTGWSARVVGGLYLVLMGLVPLGADYMRDGLTGRPRDEPLQAISTLSPIGALIQVWAKQGADPRVGIGVQVALAVLFALLLYAWEARGRKAPRDV